MALVEGGVVITKQGLRQNLVEPQGGQLEQEVDRDVV